MIQQQFLLNMKKLFLSALMAFSGLTVVQAQDTYLNDRVTNNSDIIGTARYVGMGGAMGALGGDLSVISNNPAGLGLYRRSDAALTMGGLFQDDEPARGDDKGRFTFDQIGFVVACPIGDDQVKFVNFGFNYQKKINYGHSLLTQQNLGGLSQCDMFAWMAGDLEKLDNLGNHASFSNPMYDDLMAAGMFQLSSDGSAFTNGWRGNTGIFSRSTSGGLYGYEFNISGNVSDRYYWGLTFGVDKLDYQADAIYEEQPMPGGVAYRLYQSQRLEGNGVNIKLGTIIRPIEESPLRFGLAIETPTWYRLKHRATYGISVADATGKLPAPYVSNEDNYLEYNVYSPWKFRASIGSTIDNFMAWDIEYQYSLNDYTKMGYPKSYDGYDGEASLSMDKDRDMQAMTHASMQGVHNLRLGMEYKPIQGMFVRCGYNFFSAPFKKTGRLDQKVGSYALDYATSTDYINLGSTSIFSLGLGLRGKHFYADIAYKYRYQRGDFYAFDDHFTSQDGNFISNNPTLSGASLTPVEVNLDRHNIAVTLGYKF